MVYSASDYEVMTLTYEMRYEDENGEHEESVEREGCGEEGTEYMTDEIALPRCWRNKHYFYMFI